MAAILLDEQKWADKILLESWVSAGGGTYPVIEPATGNQIGSIGRANVADVHRAAQVALDAQVGWAALPYDKRAAVMRRAGDLFIEHASEIAGWLGREAGSAPMKAFGEVQTAAGDCYEAAGLASAPFGEILRSAQPRLSFSRQVPVGVVGVIAPFNVPLALAIRAVAPALSLGNSVILKPDPRTAVSGGVVIGEIFSAAGLPDGVLTVLSGAGDVGAALVEHPDVPVIAFTGSTRAGRSVAVAAAQHLKRVHLELGGNSALLVLEDVDVEGATSLGAFGTFFNQGQVCMTIGRHLVHESIADEYVQRLADRATKLTVGDPSVGNPDLGPIIDVGQRDSIHRIVSAAVDEGASVAAGGTFDGLFYRPTVLSGVAIDSLAATQEIFGPVAPVLTFSSVDEAISMARHTEYGLSLGILTRDVMRGLRIAERIPSGMVHINDQPLNGDATVPFGGTKDSGTGSRHGGVRANLESFTETQWTTVRSGLPSYPF